MAQKGGWMARLGFHPYADAFPLLGVRELSALAQSISTNGLREPIVLHADGRILDGRNRFLACEASATEPRFTTFDGSDGEALSFVADTNLHRRHLTESQRAIAAARVASFSHGGARLNGPDIVGVTQKQAASIFGVSERTVRDGRLVLDHGPTDMSADVEQGILAVRAAAEIIRAAGRDRVLAAEFYRLRRSSRSFEWRTPRRIIDLSIEVMGAIDLDPASPVGNPWVPATHHLTQVDDGLANAWQGRVFLNPPWGKDGSPRRWVAKLVDEYENGDVSEAILLVPARMETRWIRRLAPYPRCFVEGRQRFSEATGTAAFPVMLAYLGPRNERFAEVFSAIGDVFARMAPPQVEG